MELQSRTPLNGVHSISTPLHSSPWLIPSSPIRGMSPDGIMGGISPVKSESSQPPILEKEDTEEERLETVDREEDDEEMKEENDKMKGWKRDISGKKKTRESRGISLGSSSNQSDEQAIPKPCTSSRKRKIVKDSDDDDDNKKDIPMPKRKRGRPPKSITTSGNNILGIIRQLRKKTEEEWNREMEITSENRPTREKKPIKLYDPTPRTPKKRSRSKRRTYSESQSISLVYDEQTKEESDLVEINSSEGEVDMAGGEREEREDPDYEMENENGEEMEVEEQRGMRYDMDGMEWNGMDDGEEGMERIGPCEIQGRRMRKKTSIWNGIPLQLPALISVDSVVLVVERREGDGAIDGLIEDEMRIEEREEGMEEDGERMKFSSVLDEHSYARRRDETLNEEIIDVVTVDDEMEMEKKKEKVDEVNKNEKKENEWIVMGNGFNIDDDVEEIHEIIEGSYYDNTANKITPSRLPIEILKENTEIMDAINEIVNRVSEGDGEMSKERGEDNNAIQGNQMLVRDIDGMNEEESRMEVFEDVMSI
ncbi:hypothetical protein PENTCL1PPCAC_17397 [Pristionchus entomophagus]|uniref:Uncharacterized protein n=1 Tax=Pristionchus entomophagus TaxID=358040 RepID=A0AAV5TM29_9BILA|nr:hypothetical protein PENTCL1PPCAC_17397 [Pristionchus entomophagus]